MAEIKVRLTGDNADFQRKLREATEESRVAAREMKAQFSEIRDTAGEIAGETGLGKIANILGAGGLTGMAVAFGTALIEGIKGGIEKAAEFESITTRIGSLAGNQPAGKEAGEFISKLVAQTGGIGGNKEELGKAWLNLQRGGMNAEEIQRYLPSMAKLAAGSSVSIGDISEQFAKGQVGIPRGLERNLDIRQAAEQFGKDRSSLELLELMTGPAGKFGTSITDQQNTLKGQAKMLGAVIDQKQEELGEKMIPGGKAGYKAVREAIPVAQDVLGQAFGMMSGTMWIDALSALKGIPAGGVSAGGGVSMSNPNWLIQAQQNEQQKKNNLDMERQNQEQWKLILDVR